MTAEAIGRLNAHPAVADRLVKKIADIEAVEAGGLGDARDRDAADEPVQSSRRRTLSRRSFSFTWLRRTSPILTDI
jgi:hypothetical protein